MSHVASPTSEEEAQVLDRIAKHHAELVSALDEAVAKVVAAPDDEAEKAASEGLASWARKELIPHVMVEGEAMYPAARTLPGADLLVDSLIAEHQTVLSAVDTLEAATHHHDAVLAAGALQAIVHLLVNQENTQLLPRLAADPKTSLVDIFGGTHELPES